MKRFLLILCLGLSQALAQTEVSQVLFQEWERFRTLVGTLEPEGQVGGVYNVRRYGRMELLWKVSADDRQNEVIRFFLDREGMGAFSVTYHKSRQIVPGRLVLRRFLGPEPTGWVGYTVDWETGAVLGRQGSSRPILNQDEEAMLREWGITLL